MIDSKQLKVLPGVRFEKIVNPLLSGAGFYPHTQSASSRAGQTICNELENILKTRENYNAELYQFASICRIFAALGDPVIIGELPVYQLYF